MYHFFSCYSMFFDIILSYGGLCMKRAIVLAGGGSKGSYQLGVWKALRELKISYDIVVGNSIGSFNAVLMVQNDFEKAWELWNNLSIDKIIDKGFEGTEDFEHYSENRDQILPFLKKYLANKGADITPYLEILDEYIVEDRFFKSKIDYGLMTVKFPSMAPREVIKKEIKKGYLKQWVQASSAVFPAFPMCKIDDETYIDGLYYDNIPIATAFRLGAEEVIAVALRPNISRRKFSGNPLVKFIEPSESLGAMLSFENHGIKKNISRGYNDAMKVLGGFQGNEYTFKNVNTKTCEEISRKMLLFLMEKELKNEIEQGTIISRYISPTPILDKVFKNGEKNSNDLFDCFIYSVETYMKRKKMDFYKVYDLKILLKAIKNEQDSELLKILSVINGRKYSSEKLQNFSNGEIVSALLVFTLISE